MKRKAIQSILAITLLGTLFGGCGINKQATLVDINKGQDSISLGYANFVARQTQSMYDGMYLAYMGDEMWSQTQDGDTMENMVKDNVLTSLEESYLLQKHAEDYGVKLTDKEKKAISKAAKQFIEDNDNETIEEMGATQEYVEQYLTEQTYVKKMESAIKEKAEVSVSEEEALQKAISYVKFSVADTTDEDGNTVELTSEEKKALKQQAQLLSKAEDFEEEAKNLGVDVETVTYGQDSTLNEKVIQAAEILTTEGEVSSVVGVKDDGYYVIRMDSLRDEDATAEKKESLEEQQREECYQKVLDGWKEDITWSVDEKQWKKVKFDTLFEVADTEEE